MRGWAVLGDTQKIQGHKKYGPRDGQNHNFTPYTPPTHDLWDTKKIYDFIPAQRPEIAISSNASSNTGHHRGPKSRFRPTHAQNMATTEACNRDFAPYIHKAWPPQGPEIANSPNTSPNNGRDRKFAQYSPKNGHCKGPKSQLHPMHPQRKATTKTRNRAFARYIHQKRLLQGPAIAISHNTSPRNGHHRGTNSRFRPVHPRKKGHHKDPASRFPRMIHINEHHKGQKSRFCPIHPPEISTTPTGFCSRKVWA